MKFPSFYRLTIFLFRFHLFLLGNACEYLAFFLNICVFVNVMPCGTHIQNHSVLLHNKAYVVFFPYVMLLFFAITNIYYYNLLKEKVEYMGGYFKISFG